LAKSDRFPDVGKTPIKRVYRANKKASGMGGGNGLKGLIMAILRGFNGYFKAI